MLLATLLLLSTTTLPVVGGELKIVHVNVGQGDATLILGPPDATGDRVGVLIDAGDIPMGGDKDGGSIVPDTLWPEGVNELDFVIVTHYDADHQNFFVDPCGGVLGDLHSLQMPTLG